MNQVLKYPGSKWRIANWIIGMMPKHHSYVEPYFGSGAVLFNKPLSNIETINDRDKRVVRLFELVRDNPEVLARLLYDTPYSRTEYEKAFEEAEDPIESSRRFLIQCWQGHGFRTNGKKVGWKNDVQGREKAYAVSNWNRLPGWVMSAHERLKSVQIENRPATELIKRFDFNNVLLYLDPPYVLNTRTSKQYLHEMNDDDHIELLELIKNHKGSIIISGYDSELYNTYLDDWYKYSVVSNAEYYNGSSKNEIIWTNFKAETQISIFD